MSVKSEWLGRWAGQTVICIGSGPSLTPEDCETVRQSGHPTIVCNTSFRLCPWASVLCCFDGSWLNVYAAEIRATFHGTVVSPSQQATRYGFVSLHGQAWFQPFGITGASAISLAVAAGASRIVLLGYDGQKTGGRSHWHGEHPKPLSDAVTIATWAPKIAKAVAYATRCKCQVVNASRATALLFIPRVDLQAIIAAESTRCG